MKNNGVVFVTILVAIITLSCSREKEIISEEVGRKLTITAYREDSEIETKTTRDVNGVVSWSAHEDISLFYSAGTNGGSKFTSTNEAPATVADFSGTINVITGVVEGDTERYFYGIYPYNEENSVNADGSIVTVIPDIQTAAEGTFADNHFVSMGRSRGLEMGFYNLCGGFKFKLLHEGVTKVTLRGNSGEELAGKVKVSLQDGYPIVTEVLDPKTELVMTCPDGGAFKTGVEYFFVMRPITFENGFTFTMETEDSAIGTRTVDVSIEVKRSYFSYASAAIDTGVEYQMTGIIVFADDAVKAICVENWDTDGDGELSYEEVATVTDLGAVFMENTEIVSFEEFQYFTGVTAIGEEAFKGCTSMTSILIPESVTCIEHRAFYNSGLLEIVVPENVISFGVSVFSQCTSLSSAVLPEGVKTLSSRIFEGCTALSFLYPSSYEVIDMYALKGTAIDKITVTKSIGMHAFEDCTNLSEVTLPDGFTSIDIYAFSRSSLKEINLPRSTNSIYSSLESGNMIIGAFYLSNIERIECYDNLLDTGNPVLYNSLIYKDYGTLNKQTVSKLKKVVVKKTDEEYIIGDYAFRFLSGLESVILPDGLTSIGRLAFDQCAMQSIFLPNTLEFIGQGAFVNCESLTSITIPDGVTSIMDYTFHQCRSLTSVTIPGSVTKIGLYAFGDCESLASVTIPDGVTSILDYAFSGDQSLTSITIPESVTSIGKSAFGSCSALTSIIVKPETPPTGGESMFVYTNNCPIYVPAGSLINYKTADVWSTYEDRIRALPSEKPFPEGNVFDEDAYITYVANHQEWQNQTNELLYAYDTQFNAGVSGTRMEMKFQIPDYDSGEAILSYHSDGGLAIDASNVSYYYNRRHHEDGDTWYEKEFTQGVGEGIDGTGTVVLTASCNGNHIEVTVNGHEATIPVSVSSLNAQYIFSHYDMESGDGTKYMYLAGVPEGARLYYVKIWDGDELVYFGHASRAVCSYSSAEEYCWYEEIGNNYTFAQSLHSLTSSEFNNPDPSSPIATVRQPFGGGMD